jgi:hypothetical protein
MYNLSLVCSHWVALAVASGFEEVELRSVA